MKACTIISKVDAPTNRTCFSSGSIQVNEHPKYSFSVAQHGIALQSTKSIFHLGHGNMYNLPNSHELRVGKGFLLSPPYKHICKSLKNLSVEDLPRECFNLRKSAHLRHVYLTQSSQDPHRTHKLTNITE